MSKAFNRFRMDNLSTRAGRKAASDDALAQLPLAVTGLTATANGATAMDLAWTNPVGQAAGVKVQIERSTPDNTSYVLIDIVDASAEAYADSGLVTATPYYYRVTAVEETPALGAAPEANDTTA